MLAVLLLNNINTGHGWTEPPRTRRPGERFVTQDEWLQAQEALTKLKAKPKREQKAVTKKAVEAVRESTDEAVKEAQEFLFDYDGAVTQLENLEVVLVAYFMLELKRRQANDVAAMLMLGVL